MKSILQLSKPKHPLVFDENFIYRVMPHKILDGLHRYFRLEVEGLENVPREGGALICPNHSGFSGLDALMLSHEIYRGTKRVPKVLTHAFWFMTASSRLIFQNLGFHEATTTNGLKLLNRKNLVVLFPEGEQGNFKPSSQRYVLQEFKRGFVRMAMQTEVPIIPTLIIGAEETHINLAQIRLGWTFKGLTLPVPLNVLPLPTKWHIKFLPPFHLPYTAASVGDRELVHEIAGDVHDRMQDALNFQLQQRKSVFF